MLGRANRQAVKMEIGFFGWLKGWEGRKMVIILNTISTEIAVSEQQSIADRILEEVRRL